MRTLVTGGAGFIGSTLVDRLLAEGHAVDVVDDLSTGSLANLADARAAAGHELTFHQLDVRSAEVVELMARRRPEVVFHLAAQADVRVSVADPVFDADVNVLGTLRVLEGARLAAGRAGWCSPPAAAPSTASPTPSELPLKESLPHRPLSPYGVSKKAAIDYLVAYRELHSLEFSALALANVYGPRQDPHGEAGVVAIFAERLLPGRAGDHLRRRRADPRLRLRRRRGRRLRPGGHQGRRAGVQHRHRARRPRSTSSTGEMAAQAGVDATAEHGPSRQGELLRSSLDPSRAGIHLGWKPWTELGDGHRRRPRLHPPAAGRRLLTSDPRAGLPAGASLRPQNQLGAWALVRDES